MKPFTSFREFYPFYLSQHANAVCRALHVVGTLTGASVVVLAISGRHWWGVPLGLVVGYAFSWVGHFFFEKNKPATFHWPWYSFLGDWLMVWDSVTLSAHRLHRNRNALDGNTSDESDFSPKTKKP